LLPARLSSQPRWITPEPLNVSPALVGAPLADPRRRGAAMAVDLLLVALLSGVSGFWLLAGLALVVLQLRSTRGSTTRKRQVVGWLGVGLIGLLVLQEAKTDWDERGQRQSPVAEAEADADDAEPSAPVASAGAASASAARAQARIEALEAQLAAERRPWSMRKQLDRLLDALGASFGWGIVYFSLLPAWWGGQTVGKKIFGLQVVELTGQPMTVMRCLKRYGGYAAGMATGGLGFAQALWDPNRQGIQDKAAHTAVIDLRAPRQASAGGAGGAGQALPGPPAEPPA
jgi:RDD family